jgi:hypothetical protein
MNFVLLGPDGKPHLEYNIDRDLYRLDLPANQQFAEDIEADISRLLNALATQRSRTDAGA